MDVVLVVFDPESGVTADAWHHSKCCGRCCFDVLSWAVSGLKQPSLILELGRDKKLVVSWPAVGTAFGVKVYGARARGGNGDIVCGSDCIGSEFDGQILQTLACWTQSNVPLEKVINRLAELAVIRPKCKSSLLGRVLTIITGRIRRAVGGSGRGKGT